MRRILLVLISMAVIASVLSGCSISNKTVYLPGTQSFDETENIITYDSEAYNTIDIARDEHEEAEIYCDGLVELGDPYSAYMYIKDYADGDPSYNDLIQKYASIYVSDMLNTAEAYAISGNYEQALYILEEANRGYSCSEFSLKIEEYLSYIPKKLAECTLIDEEDYDYIGHIEDCFGNVYEVVFGFHGSLGSDDGGYAVFYLNGMYDTLSGCFVGSNELYEDMEVDCKIYADGNLIYESARLGRTSPPVNINIDITDVEQLRVEYMSYSWWTTEPCCIFDLTVS